MSPHSPDTLGSALSRASSTIFLFPSLAFPFLVLCRPPSFTATTLPSRRPLGPRRVPHSLAPESVPPLLSTPYGCFLLPRRGHQHPLYIYYEAGWARIFQHYGSLAPLTTLKPISRDLGSKPKYQLLARLCWVGCFTPLY